MEVTYWEKWTGFEGEAMRKTVEAFNAKQDRIHVKLLTTSQIDRKMLMATAGDSARHRRAVVEQRHPLRRQERAPAA